MAKSFRPLLSLILLVKIASLSAELYTSMSHMVSLVDAEIEVTKHLDNFLEEHIKTVEKARKMLDDFKLIAEQARPNPENFVGNPVNSFLLIKKLSKDLQVFVDTLNHSEQLKGLVHQIKEKYNLPTADDYKGAIVALHRLEDTYLLSPRDIRTGNLSKAFPSRPLTAFECFEFGRIAYEEEDFYHTIRWMDEAIERTGEEKDKPTADLVDILDYYSFATGEQGNINHAIELTNKILAYNPGHERAKGNLLYYRKFLKDRMDKMRGDSGTDESLERDPFEFKNERQPGVLGYVRDLYEALCRDDHSFSDKKLIKGLQNLKCRYVNYHPFLLIGPIKEEMAFSNPPIWVYHDVISDEMIGFIKELASPKLKRAIVRSPVTGEFETADYRISKSAWLNDREYPDLSYLTNLVAAITNLSMTTAEEWQIANYGIGGQYDPHFDFARKTEPGDAFHISIGNRIATWLFYLEVPEKGGATVFPRIGARVQPIRRSAAFWYNLYPSGDGDYRTRHAACPVLFGTKWVSNKWIHMVGQEFLRPCQLTRGDNEEARLDS